MVYGVGESSATRCRKYSAISEGRADIGLSVKAGGEIDDKIHRQSSVLGKTDV